MPRQMFDTPVVAVTRREFLSGLVSSSLLGSSASASAEAFDTTVSLRILATSDLHMYVEDWDYLESTKNIRVGLVKVASLIRQARREARNVVLFDNGDYLQGSAAGDYIWENVKYLRKSPHPLIEIMNDLDYSAVALGNHEFNFGLKFLEQSFRGAKFPFLCANVKLVSGDYFTSPYQIIKKKVVDNRGQSRVLRLGVIGFVPPMIMNWDGAVLRGKVEAFDILATARQVIPQVREQSDLVIVLAHSGISAAPWVEGAANLTLQLSEIPEIDAIVCGHSHRVFPGPDYSDIPGADARRGLLNGVPAVMPGYWGSHLGVIDLKIVPANNRWVPISAEVAARPIFHETPSLQETVQSDTAVSRRFKYTHRATISYLDQAVGKSDYPLHSFFVLLGINPIANLINTAQLEAAKQFIIDSDLASLPLLSAASVFRAGLMLGTYTDIGAGSLKRKDIFNIYMFGTNTLAVVALSGGALLEWLEYSVGVFETKGSGVRVHSLRRAEFPTSAFDVIGGIHYEVDISQPPRYSRAGVKSENKRISAVTYKGKPIDLEGKYLVVTNSFRAYGGGNVPGLTGENIVLQSKLSNRKIVENYVSLVPLLYEDVMSPWIFKKLDEDVKAYVEAPLAARRYLNRYGNLEVAGFVADEIIRVSTTIGKAA